MNGRLESGKTMIRTNSPTNAPLIGFVDNPIQSRSMWNSTLFDRNVLAGSGHEPSVAGPKWSPQTAVRDLRSPARGMIALYFVGCAMYLTFTLSIAPLNLNGAFSR